VHNYKITPQLQVVEYWKDIWGDGLGIPQRELDDTRKQNTPNKCLHFLLLTFVSH